MYKELASSCCHQFAVLLPMPPVVRNMKILKDSEFRVAPLLLLALFSVLTSRFTAMASSPSRGPNGTAEETNPVRNLYIGAFFSFPKIFYQPSVAQAAIDHINSLQGILDGYHLEMRWNWTGVSHFQLTERCVACVLTDLTVNKSSTKVVSVIFTI